MNSFLGKLIDRHQEFSGQSKGDKVQPRPKARFEREPLATTNPSNSLSDDYGIAQSTKSDLETGSLVTPQHPDRMKNFVTGMTPSLTTQTPSAAPEISDPKSARSVESQRFDDMNERISAISIQLGRNQHAREKLLRPTAHQKLRQKEIKSNLTDDSTRISTENFSLEGGLNNRVQEILQRLQNQQPVEAQNPNGLDLPNEPSIANLSNKEITEPGQTLIQTEIRPKELGRPISEHAQPDNRQVDPSVVQQPGLLQLPTWLAQMQANLNNRWQKINAKAEAEPVVNVTIGRVEVRAVQPDAIKQPKVRNKPSGVMSLDDYLKQREHRGRV